METRQLTTFRAVAQTLSFSRAANQLNYAQSTVSSQIQSLEEELGVALFDRLGKSIVLTDAGQRLFGYAEKILNLTDEALAIVSNADTLTGSLTISAPETLCTYRLPKVLRQFRRQYPKVQISFHPEFDLDVKRRLQEGHADVAFTMSEPFQKPGLNVEPLVREPLLIVAYPEHPLAQAESVTFADLHEESFLLTEAACNYRRLFERALNAAGITAQPMEFHSVEAIKQCVMAGIGLSLLPLVSIKSEIDRGQLVPINWSGRDFEVITHVVWHEDKWVSPALSAFLEVVREYIATPQATASSQTSLSL
ncbi:MAG: LysR family transcriptional regulator [Anaerolineae bacterium]|nr:LysR family transcriptional regulator [Anaerolineae bacterium]